jgi:hypothetical protein
MTNERTAPLIDPTQVRLQMEGFHWNWLCVRLPASATLADLNDPTIWRRVQGSVMSLKKLDRVALIAYDEAWVVDCIVAGATGTGVTLSKPVKHELQPRTEVLMQDDTYIVRWVGAGYAVFRKKDDQRVSHVVTTKAEAELDLGRMYPRSAA